MKQNKRKQFLEFFVETLITVVCFIIGAVILGLCGVDFDNMNDNFEVIVLLGIGTLLIIYGIVSSSFRWIKKAIRAGKTGV